MKALHFRIGSKTCRLFIGRGAGSDALLWKSALRGYGRVALVTDRRIHALLGRRVERALRESGTDFRLCFLPPGETAKTLGHVDRLCRFFARQGLDRGSAVAALGGGSVSDAAGFAAAVYLRGIDWITVPTTLLGQIDSAIGGKVGVNHAGGKNQIGAVHQPAAIVSYTSFIRSLPGREKISGLGEMIKYGLVFDARFFDLLRRRWDGIVRCREPLLTRSVVLCARLKAGVVARDERDVADIRAVLNFGHTWAHALETLTGYSRFAHGEAVVWGMRAATALSVVKGHLRPATADAIDAFLRAVPVPPLPRAVARLQAPALHRLWRIMLHDKKAQGGAIRFILLRRVGQTLGDATVTRGDVEAALRLLLRSPSC